VIITANYYALLNEFAFFMVTFCLSVLVYGTSDFVVYILIVRMRDCLPGSS